MYIGTQTMRRCIISIAQGIDGNIYLATYQKHEGRMEYYHYNMNNAGLATEFELHSSIEGDLYTRWPLYYNGLMYFKIICSSDGTKLVVFREKELHYFVSVFSTDNFQPICEVRMFEERIKTWRTNKSTTIRDVKFACNDSYLLMLDSDSVLYSVNISTATWDRIIHGTQYNIAEGKLYYANNKINDKFDNKIDFKTTLIPYRVNTSWIEKKLVEMKDVLNLDEPPKIEKTCEKCAYLEGGKKF